MLIAPNVYLLIQMRGSTKTVAIYSYILSLGTPAKSQ